MWLYYVENSSSSTRIYVAPLQYQTTSGMPVKKEVIPSA